MIEKTPEGSRVEASVEIDVAPESVWQALTDPELVQRWFPLRARGSGEDGGVLEVSWDDESWWAMTVVVEKEHRHLRLVTDEPGPDGDPLTLIVDWHLRGTGDGTTTVRMVHSGFGPGDDWDEYLEGLDGGWSYFLRNLKVYLERHPGTPRTMVAARPAVAGDRALLWRRSLAAWGLDADHAPPAGDVELLLDDVRARAVTESRVDGRAIGVRLPEHGDALLLVEIEGVGEQGRVGMWMSMYAPDDEERALLERAVEAAAARLEGA